MKDTKENNYNKIKPKDNMKVDNNGEEVVEKSERKPLDKVVTTVTKKRKKGLMERLVTGVLGPDGLPSIGSYLNEEIIIPSIKNIVVDAVTSGINMAIFGDTKGRAGSTHGHTVQSNRTHYRPATNYTSRYTSAQAPPARPESRVATVRYGVEEYLIENRAEAQHVLSSLHQQADNYDSVSIADYYDLIGVPTEWTDNTYGWTFDAILKATVTPIRGGYTLRFPTPTVI